jgi:Mg-chelatase subunit ChlD
LLPWTWRLAGHVGRTRLGRAAAAVHAIDTEDGPVRLGLAADIASAAGGRQLHRLAPAATGRRVA